MIHAKNSTAQGRKMLLFPLRCVSFSHSISVVINGTEKEIGSLIIASI